VKHKNFSRFVCRFDLEEKRVSIVGTFPEVTMKCQYDLDGKILLVPIQGTGPSTIVLSE
jgi:hypothetical protein